MENNFDTYCKIIKHFMENSSNLSIDSLKSVIAGKILIHDRKAPVDHAFRDQVLVLLSKDDDSVDHLKQLLKLSTDAALTDTCSPSLPFLIFADVFNTKTISFCESIFSFMEDTILSLKDTPLFSSGRNTLLRMCNDLLRRLSKSQNTVFCGRIQLFLSRLFPLDEKSGLNLMSHFNVENSTPFDKAAAYEIFNSQMSSRRRHSGNSTSVLDGPEIEMEEGEMKDSAGQLQADYDLYTKFWSLQDFFRYPVQCYEKHKWRLLRTNTDELLSTFASFKLDGGSSKQYQSDTRFTKYLTSPKLIDLQLMDSTFRRYILVQILILFQYLTSTVKFKGSDHQLSDDQTQWITKSRDQIYSILAEMTAGEESDTDFTTVVSKILAREEHWSQWKNESCPSFLRHNIPSDEPNNPRKRRGNPLVDRTGKKVIRFPNPELHRLWNLCPDNMAACEDSNRIFNPSLSEYFEEARVQMDPEEKVDDEYKLIKSENWTWRSLRFLSRKCPQFYMNSNAPGRPIEEYISTIMDKIESDSQEAVGSTNGVDAEDEKEEKPGGQEEEDEDDEEEEDGHAGDEESQSSPPEHMSPPEVKSEELHDEDEERSPREVETCRRSRVREFSPESVATDETSQQFDTDVQILRSQINFLSENVGPRWQKLGHALCFEEDGLLYIQDLHKGPDEQAKAANKVLRLWLEGNTAVSPTKANLVKALNEADMNSVAIAVEKF